MKKTVLLTVSLLFAVSIMAQDRNNNAYKAGQTLGRALAFALVAGLLIWFSLRFIKKNRNRRY